MRVFGGGHVSPTFPLDAVVVLVVILGQRVRTRLRQHVLGGARHPVLTVGVLGAEGAGGGHGLHLPAVGAVAGAHPLAHGAARHHRILFGAAYTNTAVSASTGPLSYWSPFIPVRTHREKLLPKKKQQHQCVCVCVTVFNPQHPSKDLFLQLLDLLTSGYKPGLNPQPEFAITSAFKKCSREQTRIAGCPGNRSAQD